MYIDTTGPCMVCSADDVPLSGIGEDGEHYVCRNCYLRIHAEGCGCDLWPRERVRDVMDEVRVGQAARGR